MYRLQKTIDSRSVIVARTARTVKTARAVAVFIFILDRVCKWYAAQIPAPQTAGIFSFGYFLNPSLFFLPHWEWIKWAALAVLIALLMIMLYPYELRTHHEHTNCSYVRTSSLIRMGLFPILLGGASNVFDRFFFGGVIDIVAIRGLGTFNLADLLIFWGLGIIFFQKRLVK